MPQSTDLLRVENAKLDPELPRVANVKADVVLIVSVLWKAGSRAGKTDTLDLAPIINAGKFFRPLRTDRELFRSVHPILGGNAIAWGPDNSIELSAGALERLAYETMTADDLRSFIDDNNLTETALAATLDYSRRQIVSFVNDRRRIPRVVSLACRYIELMKQTFSVPAPRQSHYRVEIPLHFATSTTSIADLPAFPPISSIRNPMAFVPTVADNALETASYEPTSYRVTAYEDA